MMRLPGLIDVHVHLREPGATHKEDWDSGTAAALAGGFTTVLAMPNTHPPITHAAALAECQASARTKARCDYGIFVGAGADNMESAAGLAGESCGLKLYLDQTFGPLRLEGLDQIVAHMQRWPTDRPVAVHAEGRSLAAALAAAELAGRSVHVCHVSRKDEIEFIRAAKEKGWRVTCEVTPHHLFLSQEDVPGLGPGRAEVRPRLATPVDRAALWDNLATVDCFASDHAPHTLAEKDSAQPPPGFPGLETSLALLLGAVHAGRLTIDDLIARLHANPRRIFGLPEQPDTWIEVDEAAEWTVSSAGMHSRCGWSPWEARRLRGRVRSVTLRGRLAVDDGRVLAPPGAGRDVAARP